MSSTRQVVSATQSTPFIYRFLLLGIEPFLVTAGAIMVSVKPAAYADAMTRGSIPFAQGNAFIYTQIGGSWLYFAFIEGVVMRMFDDLALWRVLCTGMLLSDIWYCAGTVQGVGGLANWANLAAWTDDDWITMVSTLPMVIVRVLIVLGIGVKRAEDRVSDAKLK
ncbi:hypothetical protein ACHAPT_012991 [Fusarium lateritium]